jgi:phospholipase/carboxylesterase
MAELLPCVEITPPGEVSSSVVWLHGLGANGHDFEPVVPHLRLPRTRFVFPHAPRRPVSINRGLIMPAWYDITGFTPATFGVDERHVRESAALVAALLDRERQRGVPSTRTVLAGFSQGGAMSLFEGLRYPDPLAGIMVLSGHALLHETHEAEQAEANRATPMLFCHGRYDPVVPVTLGRSAYEACAEGRDARWHELPIEHSVSMEEIELIAGWLKERLEPSS